MAKLNITIDLDWINEYGCIDEVIKQELINSIVEKFNENIKKEIINKAEQIIINKIEMSIDNKVNEITEQLLNRKFDLLDNWGDIKRKDVTVVDLLKEKLENFLHEKVDEDGRTDTYNKKLTRIDYIINKNINYTMKKKIDEVAIEIRKGLEKYIEDTLKVQIGENIIQLIGVDKIVNKLNK